MNLISTASLKFYPDNKLSHFRTVIPVNNGLTLDGAWEVALSEIVFPSMMNNITGGGWVEFQNFSRDFHPIITNTGDGLFKSVDIIMNTLEKKLKPS